MSYAIREVIEHSRVLEKKGHRVLKLNIGDPVKFDFSTPDHIKRAFIRAIEEGRSGYSDSEGIPPLLEAAARSERDKGVEIQPEDVVATTGVTEGLEMVLAATLDESSEILIPGPSYPAYVEYPKLFGADPVAYRKIEAQDWMPDLDDIRRKITPRTKAIIICSPNNPTGALYSKSEIGAIMDIAAENELLVISDEIYDRVIYEEETNRPAAINKDVPTVILNGLSKVHICPGWRVGYIAFRDPRGDLEDIKEGVMKQARARLCANTVAQYGLLAALEGPDEHVREMCQRLKPRRDLAVKMINEIDGLSVTVPKGAFYMFPRIDPSITTDDKRFVLDVLENCHVLLVHGSGFHPQYGKGHFRIVFLPPEEVLEEALGRIGDYVSSLAN